LGTISAAPLLWEGNGHTPATGRIRHSVTPKLTHGAIEDIND
jgi:hypothetical protein